MATNENTNCTCTTPEYTIILNQQGPSGRQGADGQNGFSPIIDVATNDTSTYTLTITTADGTFTTPNLKSPLPTGGSIGQVLTNFGNDTYGWDNINAVTIDTLQEVYATKTFVDADLNITTDGEIGKGYTITAENNKPQIIICSTSNGIPVGSIGFVLQTDNIIQGEGITITPNLTDGTVTFAATIPVATTTTLGSVKPDGTTITVDTDGTIHGASTYTLPQATDTTLGGIKAEAKQDTDTQPVRIDTTTGLLYTAAGADPTSIDGGNAFSTSAVAVINNISQQVDTNEQTTMNTVEEIVTITTPEETT